MKRIKELALIVIAYVGIAISILSLFTTVVKYTDAMYIYRFSAVGLIRNAELFEDVVLNQYTGKVLWDIDATIIIIFVVIGLLGIICAIAGLAALSKQRKNTWPFVLTVVGLVATMCPSVLVFVGVSLSEKYFEGELACGLYPILTPVVMAICIVVSTLQFRRIRKINKSIEESEGRLTIAGDL